MGFKSRIPGLLATLGVAAAFAYVSNKDYQEIVLPKQGRYTISQPVSQSGDNCDPNKPVYSHVTLDCR